MVHICAWTSCFLKAAVLHCFSSGVVGAKNMRQGFVIPCRIFYAWPRLFLDEGFSVALKGEAYVQGDGV